MVSQSHHQCFLIHFYFPVCLACTAACHSHGEAPTLAPNNLDPLSVRSISGEISRNSSECLRQMFPSRAIQSWLLHRGSGPWPIDIHIISINHKWSSRRAAPCLWTLDCDQVRVPEIKKEIQKKKNPLKTIRDGLLYGRGHVKLFDVLFFPAGCQLSVLVNGGRKHA